LAAVKDAWDALELAWAIVKVCVKMDVLDVKVYVPVV
jgi:hypothetical protein